VNWEIIATIVEAVGAVAVVVTLFYLALQIRQSTIQARRSELDASMDHSALARMAIAENQELAEIWLAGLTGDGTLSESRQLRFDALVSQRFWALFHVYDRVNSGVMERSFWQGASQQLEDLIARPGAAGWWHNNAQQFPQHYVDEVERTINRVAKDRTE